jgi:hypothetical protein
MEFSSLKKFISNELKSYFKQFDFTENSTSELTLYGINKSLKITFVNDKRWNEYYDSVYSFSIIQDEHISTCGTLRETDIIPNHLGYNSIHIPSIYDLNLFFSYSDETTKNNECFKVHNEADAKIFISSIKTVFEHYIKPLFEKITSSKDIDDYYNLRILVSDVEYIKLFSEEHNSDKWWPAYVAAILAKNPRLSELKEIYASWMTHPWMQETFEKINQYFNIK